MAIMSCQPMAFRRIMQVLPKCRLRLRSVAAMLFDLWPIWRIGKSLWFSLNVFLPGKNHWSCYILFLLSPCFMLSFGFLNRLFLCHSVVFHSASAFGAILDQNWLWGGWFGHTNKPLLRFLPSVPLAEHNQRYRAFCRRILNGRRLFISVFQHLSDLRRRRPYIYTIICICGIVNLEILTYDYDGILIAYVLTIIGLLIPGIRHTGVLRVGEVPLFIVYFLQLLDKSNVFFSSTNGIVRLTGIFMYVTRIY